MGIFESVLMAVSLCADCFAVSTCSSVTMKDVSRRQISILALSFAVIQAAFLLAGWLFGNVFIGLVYKVSHIIGFLLLLYVGGGMFIEGVKGEEEARDLNGWKNIIIGGIATSIDALAVGVAQSMAGQDWPGFCPLLIAVFVVTAISVISGMLCGHAIGHKFGRWAEIAGGLVLVGIGVGLLF